MTTLRDAIEDVCDTFGSAILLRRIGSEALDMDEDAYVATEALRFCSMTMELTDELIDAIENSDDNPVSRLWILVAQQINVLYYG